MCPGAFALRKSYFAALVDDEAEEVSDAAAQAEDDAVAAEAVGPGYNTDEASASESDSDSDSECDASYDPYKDEGPDDDDDACGGFIDLTMD